MKLKVKVLILTVLVFFMGIACVSGGSSKSKPRPKWMEDINSVYPDTKFLAAIGQGDTLKDAQSNASGVLATMFKVSIEVESSLQSRYAEYSKNGVVSTSDDTIMTDSINQSSNQTLMNVKYGETWKDSSGIIYALAYLNRAETGMVYKTNIESNGDSVKYLMGRSAEQTSPLKKYAFLDAALVVAQNNEVLVEQLAIISPAMGKAIRLPYDLKSLKTQRTNAASSMVFQISIQKDGTRQISNMLTDFLTAEGFTVKSPGLLQITGTVTMENVELDNGYENVKWYLMINMLDDEGQAVVSLEKNSRSSGVSQSAAQARGYKDMEKAIKKDFLNKMTSYFDSFIEK